MKQLNDKETGNFIRIDKIDINNNRVVYTDYETIIYDNNGLVLKECKGEQKGYEFKSINLQSYLDTVINFSDLVINTLKVELFTNYEISEYGLNWLFEDKAVCLVINNTESNRNLNNIEYLALLNKIVTNQPNRIVQTTNILIYVNGIDENDLSDTIDNFIGNWIHIQYNPKKILNLNII